MTHRFRRRLQQRGVSRADASLAVGRNKAYLSQYLSHGMPRVLSFQDSAALTELLDCDPALLRHAGLPPPRRWKRRKPRPPSGLAAVPEIAIDPSARADARGEKPRVREKARWQMPDAMIREEFRAEPANLRIARASGEAMEPALRAGDRLVVDTARRLPGAAALFVSRLSGGFEVSRVERIDGTDPPTLRLSCAHPDYPDRTYLSEENDILGEAIWKMIMRSAWANGYAWNFRCTPDRIATPVPASLPSADLRTSLPSGLRSEACPRSRPPPPKFVRNGRKTRAEPSSAMPAAADCSRLRAWLCGPSPKFLQETL